MSIEDKNEQYAVEADARKFAAIHSESHNLARTLQKEFICQIRSGNDIFERVGPANITKFLRGKEFIARWVWKITSQPYLEVACVFTDDHTYEPATSTDDNTSWFYVPYSAVLKKGDVVHFYKAHKLAIEARASMVTTTELVID